VRPDGDDRAPDLAQPAQQLDLYLLTGMVAFDTRRHDEQPVGAHERRQHSGAAWQRGGDDLAFDAPEPHPHPVVRADRGGELAGQSRARRGAFPWCSALQGG
jgi:hypothetical protein